MSVYLLRTGRCISRPVCGTGVVGKPPAMSANSKLTRYLRDAHGAECEAAERLAGVIARTGRADHRVHLESHLRAERDHAQRLETRLRELGSGESTLAAVASLVEGIVGRAVDIATFPLHVLRGSANDAEVLRNAQELAAAEALEVARYTALERLAKRAGDEKTAELATWLREQEQAQLDLLEREIPRLADHVLGDDVAPPRRRAPAKPRRKPAQRKRPARRRPAAETSAPSRRPRRHSQTAGPHRADAARLRQEERSAEPSPGPELHVEEPWPEYDSMSAVEVAERVAGEEPAVRAAVRLYEAAHEGREVVMRATSDG